MATEDLVSVSLTKRDSSPREKMDAHEMGGILKEASAAVEASNGMTSGSTYRMCQVPSNARISQVLLSSDQFSSTGAFDVGIYQTTANGGAVVDADHFASAVDCNSAALANSDVTHESGQNPIDDTEKPLWEALGLSADPKIDYDIVLTSTATNGSAGTLALKVRYAI